MPSAGSVSRKYRPRFSSPACFRNSRSFISIDSLSLPKRTRWITSTDLSRRGAAGTYDIQAVRHRLLPFLVPELLIDGSKIVECPRLSYRVFLRPEYRDAAVKIGQNPSPRFVGIPWPRGRAILSWLHPIVVRRRRVPRGSPEKSARREFSKPSRRSSARALH